MELYELSLSELATRLADGDISSREITESCLCRIAERDSETGAFITVCGEQALEQADKADSLRARGDSISAVCGIPIAVKDNICTDGIRTTCASKMLADFTPCYDAEAVSRLKKAGAVIIGKTNLDEFAMGSTGENSALRITKNPINSEFVPGGSSCGSAAAVADMMCPVALGSDTGGSVRVPAAFCGVVGVKPSYGAISRSGLIAFASSLDQIGIIARNAYDALLISQVLYGADEKDMTSRDVKSDMLACSELSGLRFAFSESLLKTSEKDVFDAVLHTSESMERAGARRVDASISCYAQMGDVYRVISSAEASSNLARFDGIKYGFSSDREDGVCAARSLAFGHEVKKRIALGVFALSSDRFRDCYEKACKVRKLVTSELDAVFKNADVLLAPVSDFAVPRRGAAKCDGAESYRADMHTAAVNLAGLPAITLNAGRDKNGCPIGIQLIARRFDDARLFSIARAVEKLLSRGGSNES